MIRLVAPVSKEETSFLVDSLWTGTVNAQPREMARIGSEIFFIEAVTFVGDFYGLIVWRGLGEDTKTYAHDAGTPIEPLGPLDESVEAGWSERWRYHPHEAHAILLGT